MPNKENLIPFTSEQSREEAKKNGRKGGIASGKARRNRKTMKETLEILLALPMGDGKTIAVEELKNFASLKDKNVDVQTLVMIKTLQDYLRHGNPALLAFIRDTIGEKPTDSVALSGTVNNPLEGLTTDELKKLISDD